jgi:hypothetical protein
VAEQVKAAPAFVPPAKPVAEQYAALPPAPPALAGMLPPSKPVPAASESAPAPVASSMPAAQDAMLPASAVPVAPVMMLAAVPANTAVMLNLSRPLDPVLATPAPPPPAVVKSVARLR